MNKNTDDRYFRTESFYLAAYLLSRGFELVNIDKIENRKQASFVFVNSGELETQVHHFHFAQDNSTEILVNVRTFVNAIKQLKTALYQDYF